MADTEATRAPVALTPVAHTTAPVGVRPLTFREMLALAKTLYDSGVLPSSYKNPSAVFAVILAGQEMGVPPMLAIRTISIMQGKLVVNADLQLALFKRNGGRAKWLQYTDELCELELVAPNGDIARECFTEADVKRAKLDEDSTDRNGRTIVSNHKKYPRMMKRARCITSALKAIGFEVTSGAYDPDEISRLETIESAGAPVAVQEAPVSAESREIVGDEVKEPTPTDTPPEPETTATEPEKAATSTPAPVAAFGPTLFPFEPRKGIKLDATETEGDDANTVKRDANGLPVYRVSDALLQRAAQWAIKQRKEKPNDSRFPAMLDAIETEIERRVNEHDAVIAERVGNGSDHAPESEPATETETPTTRAE